MAQEYTDYMSQYNAQREREAQLIEKYNQTPEMPANRLIWQSNTVEKYTAHGLTNGDVAKAVIGIALAGLILIIAICFA